MSKMKELEIRSITQKEANAFVKKFHRHHGPTVGSIFQIACTRETEIVGVVIVGRPVSRHFDNGATVEVTRLCTNGTQNACSLLYSAAWRAAKALGWKRLITYILKREKGISLQAAGWRLIGEAGGGSWNREKRLRTDLHPVEKKLLFEAPSA